MKAGEYEVPDDLLYTKEHEWLRIGQRGRAVTGVTDYAAKMLHDVVYVELPAAGSTLRQSEKLGSVESIKTVSDIYSPVTGKVVTVNDELSTKPELVNQSPYRDGWMLELEPTNLEVEKTRLLSAADYAALITQPKAKKS